MNGNVTLNRKEQLRLKVVTEIEAGRLTGQEAATLLGLSLRHTRRLVARYRAEGAAALAHGNRGVASRRRLPEETRAAIVQLAQEAYHDYNDSHFTDELGERHDIHVSRSTVRRLRRAAGLGSPRKRRAPRHRRRRQRYPRAGMLIQADGSKHDWLEGRGPWLTLIAGIDDATSEVVGALFRYEEDATGYALWLHRLSQTHGLPLAVYADRHTIFHSPREPTIDEQLAGLEPRTQLGWILERLNVRLIPAHSPQAKGRVERLFGTLQDRLVKELRRAEASTLEAANDVLRRYLPRFNRRFARPAAELPPAYSTQLTRAEATRRIHFTYWRTVANDHTLSLFGHVIALPRDRRRKQPNLAGRRVALHQHLDGRITVVHHNQVVATLHPEMPGPPKLDTFTPAAQHLALPPPPKPASPKPAPPPPSRPTPRRTTKPAADHPWRRPWKTSGPSSATSDRRPG